MHLLFNDLKDRCGFSICASLKSQRVFGTQYGLACVSATTIPQTSEEQKLQVKKVFPANLIAAAKQTQAPSFRTMFKICREVSPALCL